MKDKKKKKKANEVIGRVVHKGEHLDILIM